MHPGDRVELTDRPHVLRYLLDVRPLELVGDRYDVALVLQRLNDLLVYPIVAVLILDAPVQTVRCEHEQKVLRRLDTGEEIMMELAGLQLFDVQKYFDALQRQVHLEQTGQLRAAHSPVAYERVNRLQRTLQFLSAYVI